MLRLCHAASRGAQLPLIGRLHLRHLSHTPPRMLKMATFSDPDFDFRGYLANRPRYPDILYEAVLKFHRGGRDTVLDIGTGPGLSLFPFAYHFQHLLGTDASDGMIAQADDAWKAWKAIQPDPNQLPAQDAKFLVCPAESMEQVADESVDLVTAATAAHWFDHPEVWKEVGRILKPNGTVAYWTYGENFLPSHPSLFVEMRRFMSTTDKFLGPYWGKPGRSILENLLLDVPFPHEVNSPSDRQKWDAESATRVHHKLKGKGEPDLAWTEGKAPEEPFRMEHIKSFEQLNGYFHTSSALARFYKEHPERKHEKPDMIDLHTAKLRETVLEQRKRENASDDGLDENHVRVAWPLGLMMIRKKA